MSGHDSPGIAAVARNFRIENSSKVLFTGNSAELNMCRGGLLQQAVTLGCAMLGSAIFFMVVAIVTALVGFTGVSATAAGIAKLLFYLSLALFVLTFLAYMVKDHPPRS